MVHDGAEIGSGALYQRRRRGHFERLNGLADVESESEIYGLVGEEADAAADERLKTALRNSDLVQSDREIEQRKTPARLVVTGADKPVSTFRQITLASAMAAPEGSTTVPVSKAVD